MVVTAWRSRISSPVTTVTDSPTWLAGRSVRLAVTTMVSGAIWAWASAGTRATGAVPRASKSLQVMAGFR